MTKTKTKATTRASRTSAEDGRRTRGEREAGARRERDGSGRERRDQWWCEMSVSPCGACSRFVIARGNNGFRSTTWSEIFWVRRPPIHRDTSCSSSHEFGRDCCGDCRAKDEYNPGRTGAKRDIAEETPSTCACHRSLMGGWCRGGAKTRARAIASSRRANVAPARSLSTSLRARAPYTRYPRGGVGSRSTRHARRAASLRVPHQRPFERPAGVVVATWAPPRVERAPRSHSSRSSPFSRASPTRSRQTSRTPICATSTTVRASHAQTAFPRRTHPRA